MFDGTDMLTAVTVLLSDRQMCKQGAQAVKWVCPSHERKWLAIVGVWAAQETQGKGGQGKRGEEGGG